MVAVALDGEFDTAALARGGGPGGLPEVVGIAIGCDHRDFGYPDYSRAIALGALADAGAISYFSRRASRQSRAALRAKSRLAVNSIGKEFTVFDAPALEPDLEAVGACTGQVNAGDRVVRILLSAGGSP